MPTLVIDWDWSAPVSFVNVPARYTHASILVRYFNAPIECLTIAIGQRRIEGFSIEEKLSDDAVRRRDQILLKRLLESNQRQATETLPSATVVVCTRDRPADLKRCLEGILRLEGPRHEILVIDNCPSDDQTEALVQTFASVRYVREPVPGLNHARNRALREATGEILVFIDDDAVPDPHWLKAHLANYTQPIVLCVTGLTVPLELEHPSQEEFEQYSSFIRGFERRVFDPMRDDPLTPGTIGAGVNMSIRRSIVEAVGGFDGALDAGTPTKSGGDHEMYSRILGAGYRIVYEPCAINRHRHRDSPDELEKAVEGYGTGAYAAMTRALFVDGEFGVFRIAWLWFRHSQARAILRALLRRSSEVDRRMIRAEIRGCLRGPGAYFRSVRSIRRRKLLRYG